MRQRFKRRTGELTENRIERLDEIGMIWDTNEKWLDKYEAAKVFYEANGNLDISANYVTADGIKLGSWYRSVINLMKKGQLSEDRLLLLKKIGFNENSFSERSWRQMYLLAKKIL